MKKCIIIGASHGGVNCAFALRKAGWKGEIILFDVDKMLPYHRPPLSKVFLTSEGGVEQNLLKSEASYVQENITLRLGEKVVSIDRKTQTIVLNDGTVQAYDKLVLATGSRPFMPPIKGIATAKNLFPMRTAEDAIHIRSTFHALKKKRIVVIGGGYIGLETAASLRKLGGEVTILEREKRVLARVTAAVLSDYFQKLQEENGVAVHTHKNVVAIEQQGDTNEILCADGSKYTADMIVIGVGIQVNLELAAAANLDLENGIKVNAATQTNDQNIHAIGDCTFHFNPHYQRFVRLESVQNAVDQGKIAAASICGQSPIYDAIPWFWSDQYEVKLQIVGLSQGYDEILVRTELDKENCFSVWYFRGDELLAVDAINNGKAFVLGTKFIKKRAKLNKAKLADAAVAFKPNNFLI